MARALELAARGSCTTSPNPRVGCVITQNGSIVGEGFHLRAGEPHAEIHALAVAAAAARGATAYVTLEPCNHQGRTPPCVDSLISAGIARVVAAMEDPNPQVAGAGLKRLAASGVSVSVGLMAAAAQELNLGFISRMTRGRPWVRLKVAASLDGKTALASGASQWITSPDARKDAHRARAMACAILTGVGTVREDNPALTVREVPCERMPMRVVVDSRLATPPAARLFDGTGQVMIFHAERDAAREAALLARGAKLCHCPGTDNKVDLAAMLNELGRLGVNELLVEGGAGLNGALLSAGLVDELLIYLAPAILGSHGRGMFDLAALTSLDERYNLDIRELRRVGQDIRLLARLKS
jgi:diaminohydroxyphosphoribosylaminopyrimidine deaminase/5-amino-6-(5-phosphoribosylamino)uracil reductase